MGYRQHLVRSLLAIREQGGLPLRDGTMLWPEPVLVGRNEAKLREIADRHGLTDWTTDLDAALARDDVQIYFDAQVTTEREKAIRPAIEAGKHIYTEKPTRRDAERRVELARAADAAGVKHGVVQDKLFLPGLRKLKRLIDGGFFGRILSVRGEFGYWVFEGDWQAAQRPSWNYRAGRRRRHRRRHVPALALRAGAAVRPVRAVTAHVATHIPERWDEHGERVRGDRRRRRVRHLRAGRRHRRADQLVLGGPGVPRRAGRVPGRRHRGQRRRRACATAASSTAPPPRSRCGTRTCRPPSTSATSGRRCPDNEEFDNGFKAQWEVFLRHVVEDAPYPWDLWAGARGVQLAELGLQSAREGRRIEIPELADERRCSLPDGRHPVRRAARSSPRRADRPPAGSPTPPRTSSPTRAENVPGAPAALDWDATLAFRHHLGRTASGSPRRWTPPSAAWAWTIRPTRELIRRSAAEARGGRRPDRRRRRHRPAAARPGHPRRHPPGVRRAARRRAGGRRRRRS